MAANVINTLRDRAYQAALARSQRGADLCTPGSDYFNEMYESELIRLVIMECAHAINNERRLNDVRSAANGCVWTIMEHFGVK